MDWCFAWLASWQISNRSDKTVRALYYDLIRILRNYAEPSGTDEIEIIDDDPELSRKREAELTAKLLALFPREPKKA